MTAPGPLLLAGGGKMGAALMAGWLARGVAAEQITVVEPNPETAEALVRDIGVRVVASLDEAAAGLDPILVMFAVKPQVMADVAPAYERFAGPGTVFLSIAAGTPIKFFQDRLGEDAAIVRAMPNTPAAVGRGATVCCANAHVTDAQAKLCHDLMSAAGLVHWIEDEELMHAVTGVSGSGPAYVFHMVEAMAAAGKAAGLPEDLADDLARATVEGAGELLHRTQGETPAVLRRNVTSPGGTTAAGLSVLMDTGELTDLMTRTVGAAAARSRELAE